MSYLDEFEFQWVELKKFAELKRGQTITKKNKKAREKPV